MKYIILKCGYEGIDKIVGLFDEAPAVEKMKFLRANPEDEWTKPEQYCLCSIDENGTNCVCRKFGLELKEPWLY